MNSACVKELQRTLPTEKNVPFKRYIFNKRVQEAGQNYEHYRTTLRKLAESCSFDTITADEILRDKLVFGIRDNRVRERLLRESALSLEKTGEICRAAESMQVQMKAASEDSVNAVQAKQPYRRSRSVMPKARECWYCGKTHEFGNKLDCPAYGKIYSKCGKRNHFSAKCRDGKMSTVRAVMEKDDNRDNGNIYSVGEEVMVVNMDDSQFITVELESGNGVRFQVDTGAQCNVLPLHIYKLATGDTGMEHVSFQKSFVTAYGGTKLPVVGQVLLRVSRADRWCMLNCKLIVNDYVRPLLGRKACVGLKLVQYLDNDEMRKPRLNGQRNGLHGWQYLPSARTSSSRFSARLLRWSWLHGR